MDTRNDEPTGDAADKDGPSGLQQEESAAALAGRATSQVKDVIDSGGAAIVWVRVLDRMLAGARAILTARKFEAFSERVVKYGHATLLVAEVLVILFGLSAAIKHSNWTYVAYGAGMAVLVVVLQYTAARFLQAAGSLVASSPSRLKSAALLDCSALLIEVGGVVIFLSFIVLARQMGQWSLLWVGLALWILSDAICCVAINPGLANVQVDEDISASEEALGILSFLVKAVMAVVPVAFGVGAIVGTIALLFGTFSLMRTGAIGAGTSALSLILGSVCLPFAGYLVFALYRLLIDVISALLGLPLRGGDSV